MSENFMISLTPELVATMSEHLMRIVTKHARGSYSHAQLAHFLDSRSRGMPAALHVYSSQGRGPVEILCETRLRHPGTVLTSDFDPIPVC